MEVVMISIDRMPMILGTLAGLITGIMGITQNKPVKDVYLLMVVFIVIFVIAGVVLKNVLNTIIEEQNIKRRKQERLLKEQEKLQNMQQETDAGKQPDMNASTIDFAIGDEDFTPLDLSQAIKSKINQ